MKRSRNDDDLSRRSILHNASMKRAVPVWRPSTAKTKLHQDHVPDHGNCNPSELVYSVPETDSRAMTKE